MAVSEQRDLERLSRSFENRSPQEILRWAVDTYYPRLCMATAFGAEGCALIQMLAGIREDTGRAPYLFNLETGYQFPETLETRDRLQERYGLPIHFVQSRQSVEEMEHQHDGPLYNRQPDLCCHLRKVIPLREAVEGYHAWISAIRRDQSAARANAGIVEWDAKFGLVKVNPLANWTRKDVWRFVVENDVPYNPLYDQGYASIGCGPCTRRAGAGADERAGRWSGLAKTECGLHVKA